MKISKRQGWMGFLAFLALFWGGMAIVFAEVLPAHLITLSPDFGKFYGDSWFADWLQELAAGRTMLVPASLLNFLGDPLWRQELFFMACDFGAALALAFYLRTQRVGRFASLAAGCLFGFCGYSLTLFCAGHGGYFQLISCGLFTFGLINRCFEERRWFYFVLLGAVAMWSEVTQPDIWLLFMLLAMAYGLWRSFRAWRAARSFDFLWKVYPKFLISILVMALIGSQAIRTALTDSLKGRQEQMHSVTQAPGESADSPEEAAARAHDNWIFATNWSLPPEDILEFAVPGIFGNESFARPYPYWGRLGQPDGFQPGRMMPNYRQHTLYLGVVVLMLALGGIVAGWRMRRRKDDAPAGEEACFEDVPFWVGAAVVATLFALGRYAPFYRLFYSLPGVNFIRCPVKFHHLTEWSVACLAGFGLEFMLKGRLAEIRKAVLAAGLALSGLAVLGVLLGELRSQAFASEIDGLGLGQGAAAVLVPYALQNLVRTFLLVLAASGLFIAASRLKGRALAGIVALLAVIGTIEMALVDARFVDVVDVSAHYAPNPVAKALRQAAGSPGWNIANYLARGSDIQDPLTTSLAMHGFPNALPGSGETDPARRAFARAGQKDQARYWRLLGVRFVILSVQAALPLVRQGALKPLCEFTVDRAGRAHAAFGTDGSAVACEVVAGLPLPRAFSAWQGGVKPGAALGTVLKAGDAPVRPVTDAPAEGSGEPGFPEVQWLSRRGSEGALATVARLPAGAMLVAFNESGAAADFVATLDGAPIPLYKANALWLAARVPSGAAGRVLRLSRKRAAVPMAVSVVVSVGVMLGFLVFVIVRRRGV